MKQNPRKLVLFDIDGTLVTTHGKGVAHWKSIVNQTFTSVFTTLPPFDERLLNGKLEKGYFWELAQLAGVSRPEFERKFPDAIRVFAGHFTRIIESGDFSIIRIEDAELLVSKMKKSGHISMGVLTGNNESIAWLKLRKANFADPFSFGAFGDEAEHRGELVKLAVRRASGHFSHPFTAGDTVVVGDTKHDIAAAKYAGAVAVGVATGHTDSVSDLEKAGADLVVTSLMDERVLTLLGLN